MKSMQIEAELSERSRDEVFSLMSAADMKTSKKVGDFPWEWEFLPDGMHPTEEENLLDFPDKLEFSGMDPD
jgi:hypothetical protein